MFGHTGYGCTGSGCNRNGHTDSRHIEMNSRPRQIGDSKFDFGEGDAPWQHWPSAAVSTDLMRRMKIYVVDQAPMTL